MVRIPATTTFYLNFATGQGFRVDEVGTGTRSTLVVHCVEKAYSTDTWVVQKRLALQGSVANTIGEVDKQQILRNNVRRWREEDRWTEAVVNPDDPSTLRTVMPAPGIPATAPYVIEE